VRGTRCLKLQFCFWNQNAFRAKFLAVTIGKQLCVICNIADSDVCFCRLMNQLTGVNIQSSVGMFTVSCQSLTYAEPLVFFVLQHSLCQIIFMCCLSDFMCEFYFLHIFCLLTWLIWLCILLTLDLIMASVC